MAKYKVLDDFYNSDKWKSFRTSLIVERGSKHGVICEHCYNPIKDHKVINAHHIIELTPENVNDHMISLNPDNILLVHHKCHNEIHQRFGYIGQKKVFVIYGPPLAGKKNYVKKYKGRYDLVVDMDLLYAAVTMNHSYDKPNELFYNVQGLYGQLIDNIKTRYGRWKNAWVIGTLADKYKRDKLISDLGAEPIFVEASREDCVNRLQMDEARKYRQDEWLGYINKWFDRYNK